MAAPAHPSGRRLRALLSQLAAAPPPPAAGTCPCGRNCPAPAAAAAGGGGPDVLAVGQELKPHVRGQILQGLHHERLPDSTVGEDGYNVAEHLPGPLQDVGPGRRYAHRKDIIREMAEANNLGYAHLKWRQYQERYCPGGDELANIVLPVVSFAQSNARPPTVSNLVILSDPDDCARIGQEHVRKMPDQAVFLGPGVLSNTDNEAWRRQRDHLNEAFLPNPSLASICAVSAARAQCAQERLAALAEAGGPIDLNEFLLHEAMAQLQLALFGLPEDVAEESNKKLRTAFSTLLDATGGSGGGFRPIEDKAERAKITQSASYLFQFIGKFMELVPDLKGTAEHLHSGCPIRGPLGARIHDVSEDTAERVFNAATFIFAGHDTTANTMTWLVFEVAQRPDIQRRLQREADALFASLGPGRAPGFADLASGLPLLTRCIYETLRLWPVVPNGTFRQLEREDTAAGPWGERVRLPKGTFVQVTNWMRHRSPKLWGPDAAEFNPDRAFTEEELWERRPRSRRFSPFTFAPRDCMGKNFAQMEMRVILAYLFARFSFGLAPPTAGHNPSTFKGVNRGTMGPGAWTEALAPESTSSLSSTLIGMYVYATPRQ